MTTNDVPARNAAGESPVRFPPDETTGWRALRAFVGAGCVVGGAWAVFAGGHGFLFTAAALAAAGVGARIVWRAVTGRGLWRLLAPVATTLTLVAGAVTGWWLLLVAVPVVAWLSAFVARQPLAQARMDLARAGLRAENQVTYLHPEDWDRRTLSSMIHPEGLAEVGAQLGLLNAPWRSVVRPDQNMAVAVGHAGAVTVVPVSVFSDGPADLLHTPASVGEQAVSDELWDRQFAVMMDLPSGADRPRMNGLPMGDVEYMRGRMGDTSGAADEFVTSDGEPAGVLLPGLAVERAMRVAMALNLGGACAPTLVYAVSGVRMNAPYGRVVVREEDGSWLGVAWVCAPDRLADLLESLPGRVGHLEQVDAMDAALDVLWEPPSPLGTLRGWFRRN